MKTFDVSKFRKGITKSVAGLSVGFRDPDTWVSTGNYTLNKLISDDFNKGIPLGKVTMIAGESGCLPETAKVKVRYKKKNLNGQYFTEQEITVAELKSLYVSREHDIKINTPDGYQPIVNWFDKGELEMVSVATKNHITRCAVNHLIQRDDNTWAMAGELTVGDNVLTESGVEEITSVESIEPSLCYDFTVDHPNHRYWGDGFSSHNSGKSYIASGNIVRNAQEQGIFVVLIDSENALDEEWLKALGVDTSEEKLLKLNMAMIDDVAKVISNFVKEYRADYSNEPVEERPKVLFVIDSLGMLMSPTEINQFESGDLKGDMGRKAKQLKALITNCVNMFGDLNIGLVATNHTYQSQDMFDPDDKISGGCLAKGTLIQTPNGCVPIESLKENDVVMSMDGPVTIEETFEFEKPCFELEFEDGHKVTVSEDHLFLVLENGHHVWKRAKDMKGDEDVIQWTKSS